MYYELYIDVFFLVNFMMDYILLLIVRKMLKCSATHGSICLGAAAGAGLTCVVMILPVPYAFIKFILFHGVVNIVMIKIGLKIRWDRSFFKAYILLYIGAVIVGGVFSCFRQYLRIGSLFFAFAIVSYYGAIGIWNIIRYMARQSCYRCEVTLYKGDRTFRVWAVIDTGNTLRDPVSKDAVSVIDAGTAKELIGEEKLEQIRYIPYHSVGKAEGVMPVFRLDRMFLDIKGGIEIETPLVAVSEEYMTADDYQMILNPDLL